MNKSKFLKKSLAMLLALMLVVAMIPLSASAALPDDLEFIKVNGASYSVEDLKVQTKDLSEDVEIGLVADLTDGWTLRAKATSGSLYDEISVGRETMALDPAQYMTVSGRTGTITLQLVNTTTEPDTVAKTYTLTVEEVDAFTTTNIELVDTGKGVYSAEIDNEKGVVKVVLARDNDKDTASNNTNDEQDEDMGAEITVRALQNATVEGGNIVDVDANDTFVVSAEAPNTSRTFRVEVVSYLDAFRSFSVDGVEGQFVDINRNNINDGIVVTLPKSALTDELGDYDNTFEVEYEAEGDLHCTVDIEMDNGDVFNNVESGDVVTFDGLILTNDTVEGTVEVTRLGGAVQYYNLTVQLENDTDTAITYVRVDKTEAQGWEDGAITVELPERIDTANETNPGHTEVTLYTKSTVTSVVLDGNDMYRIPRGDAVYGQEYNNVPDDETAWRLDGVDLTTQKVITVTAEDVNESAQYTIVATMAERNDDAKLNSFFLLDGNGNSYGGEINGKELVIGIPYMTRDISNWTMTWSTSSGAKLQVNPWNRGWWDPVKGVTEAHQVGFAAIDDPNDVLSLEVRAIDKNDSNIDETYTIKVALLPMDEGNTITNLRFTSQLTYDFDENLRSDKSFWRAIERDVNEFGTEVYTDTAQNHHVQTLNIPIAPSLITNVESDYTNLITEIAPVDGTQVFIRKVNGNAHRYLPINLLVENWNDGRSATALESGDEIVAMPQDVARWALVQSQKVNGGNPWAADGEIDLGDTINNIQYANSGKMISEFCTTYVVNITARDYLSENELTSFQVGDSELDVDSTTGTITGEIAWGLTVPTREHVGVGTGTSHFAEFEMDDYALLTAEDSNDNVFTFFSNGDVDGDGDTDTTPDGKTERPDPVMRGYYNNRRFVFERAADGSVNVYLVNGKNDEIPIDGVTVLAEDRLDNAGGATHSTRYYEFDLTWAEPETEADILTFSVDGYTGTIDDSDPENRTITVKNVPYGTDVTGMIAEFTTTPGAAVHLTTPGGVLVESGVTSINYTNPVLLYVVSEDGHNENSYTVTIDMGLTFSDIDEDDWFYDDVVDAANEGYVEGMGDGKYEPKGSLTRAQFATMIARAMNYEDKPASPAAFTDVNGHWAADAINFCAENGIVDGYEDCTFKPDQAVTRQEVAAMLTRAFDLVEVSGDKYPDDASISGWASEYVYKCLAAGLMKGDKDTGNFRPASILNRAEAATILMNANREGIID